MTNVGYQFSDVSNRYGIVQNVYDSRGNFLGLQIMVSAGHPLNQHYSKYNDSFVPTKKRQKICWMEQDVR